MAPFSFYADLPTKTFAIDQITNVDRVKNPVLPHGTSSKEKAILAIHPLPLGWAPALPSGASWLFHVTESESMRRRKPY
jgi:hypothetical protein